MLLDQIDALSAKIEALTLRVDELIAQIPAAQAPALEQRPGAAGTAAAPLPAVARLDEITGIGVPAAQVIIAEVGLDMRQFPTPGDQPPLNPIDFPVSRRRSPKTSYFPHRAVPPLPDRFPGGSS